MTEKLRVYWTSWANGNIVSAQKIVESCPELFPLYNTPQSRTKHAEGDCAKHTLLTCEAANELAECVPSNNRRLLRFAALLHDVGKPDCLIEAAPGVYSFPNHSRRSATMARVILDRYSQLPVKERELILALINNHELPLFMIQNGKPILTLRKISMECNLELLYYLTKANYMGRISPNLRERFEELEAFKAWCVNNSLWGEKSWDGLLNQNHYKRYGKDAKTVKSIINWFYLGGVIENATQAQRWLLKSRSWKWGTLFMTVGPPGSGKTTWLQKNYDMMPTVTFNNIKEQLASSVAPANLNEEAYKACVQKIKNSLVDGKQILFDSTNLSYDNRRKLIDIARNFGATIVIIFFSTNYNSCLSRLKLRHDIDNAEEKLNEYYYNFDYISSYEYDKIIYVD